MMVLQRLADLYKSKHLLSGIFYLHRMSHPHVSSIDRKVRTHLFLSSGLH